MKSTCVRVGFGLAVLLVSAASLAQTITTVNFPTNGDYYVSIPASPRPSVTNAEQLLAYGPFSSVARFRTENDQALHVERRELPSFRRSGVRGRGCAVHHAVLLRDPRRGIQGQCERRTADLDRHRLRRGHGLPARGGECGRFQHRHSRDFAADRAGDQFRHGVRPHQRYQHQGPRGHGPRHLALHHILQHVSVLHGHEGQRIELQPRAGRELLRPCECRGREPELHPAAARSDLAEPVHSVLGPVRLPCLPAFAGTCRRL